MVCLFFSQHFLIIILFFRPSIHQTTKKAKLKISNYTISVWTPEYVARINPIKVVTPASSLLDVCELFARGVKRVVVMENDGQQIISRIVSQSWLVNELFSGVSAEATNVTLAELGVVPKQVIRCYASQHAIDAFKVSVV
jgi:CBS domain-containing protein